MEDEQLVEVQQELYTIKRKLLKLQRMGRQKVEQKEKIDREINFIQRKCRKMQVEINQLENDQQQLQQEQRQRLQQEQQ